MRLRWSGLGEAATKGKGPPHEGRPLESRSCDLYLYEAADCSAYSSGHVLAMSVRRNIGESEMSLKVTYMSHYRYIHNIWKPATLEKSTIFQA